MGFVIYFTRYVYRKSIKMLGLHYLLLMGQTEEHEGSKHLMCDDYMLDKVLGKIKEIIGIEKVDDTKILINTDDKLPDDITSKNVILITCVISDDGKFYPQIYLAEASVV